MRVFGNDEIRHDVALLRVDRADAPGDGDEHDAATKGFLFRDQACYSHGMIVSSDPITEAEILTAVVGPDKPDLPAESARSILELRFGQPATDRLNELAEKNRQGTLSEMERNELDSYLRVGNFLNLMQAKARNSLVHAS